MAGSQWGLAGGHGGLRLAAVIFPLLAWPGLIFLGPVLTPQTQAVLFAALLLMDHRLLRLGLIAPSYWRLRLQVSAVVIASLSAALWAAV